MVFKFSICILPLLLIWITPSQEYSRSKTRTSPQTDQRTLCMQSGDVSIWCGKGYKCCNYQADYWCCKSTTHKCSSNRGSCEISVAMILIIVSGAILVLLGSFVYAMYRRRKQRLRKITQQQQEAQQQVSKMQLDPTPEEQQPQNYPNF